MTRSCASPSPRRAAWCRARSVLLAPLAPRGPRVHRPAPTPSQRRGPGADPRGAPPGRAAARQPVPERPLTRQQRRAASRRTGSAYLLRRPPARDALVADLRRGCRFGVGLEWRDIARRCTSSEALRRRRFRRWGLGVAVTGSFTTLEVCPPLTPFPLLPPSPAPTAESGAADDDDAWSDVDAPDRSDGPSPGAEARPCAPPLPLGAARRRMRRHRSTRRTTRGGGGEARGLLRTLSKALPGWRQQQRRQQQRTRPEDFSFPRRLSPRGLRDPLWRGARCSPRPATRRPPAGCRLRHRALAGCGARRRRRRGSPAGSGLLPDPDVQPNWARGDFRCAGMQEGESGIHAHPSSNVQLRDLVCDEDLSTDEPVRLPGQRLPPAGAPQRDGSAGSPRIAQPLPVAAPQPAALPLLAGRRRIRGGAPSPQSPSPGQQRRQVARTRKLSCVDGGRGRTGSPSPRTTRGRTRRRRRPHPAPTQRRLQGRRPEEGAAAAPATSSPAKSPGPPGSPSTGGGPKGNASGAPAAAAARRRPLPPRRRRRGCTPNARQRGPAPARLSVPAPRRRPEAPRLRLRAPAAHAHRAAGQPRAAAAPWLDSDIGEHRALSSVVMRDFRMRALLSTIGDAAMLLATPIPSLAVATGEYSLGGALRRGGPCARPPRPRRAPCRRCPRLAARPPLRAPAPPQPRTAARSSRCTSAPLRCCSPMRCPTPTRTPSYRSSTRCRRTRRSCARWAACCAAARANGACRTRWTSAAAEVARANAALLEEGGGAGALLVPRSIRMALGPWSGSRRAAGPRWTRGVAGGPGRRRSDCEPPCEGEAGAAARGCHGGEAARRRGRRGHGGPAGERGRRRGTMKGEGSEGSQSCLDDGHVNRHARAHTTRPLPYRCRCCTSLAC